MRTYIASHHPDNFLEIVSTDEYESYYDFHIFESEIWNDTYLKWVERNCYNQNAGINRVFTGAVIIIQAGNGCSSGRTYGIILGEEIYKIRSAPDTMDFEGIWELLKTAQPQ
jgi:hypothetical protein